MDIIDRLERWGKVKTGDMPEFAEPNHWGDVLHADIEDALKEIRRLRGLAGAVSELPAEDQALFDKSYGAEGLRR